MTDDTVTPEASYSPHFNFKIFSAETDPIDERLVFALRYQVYCLERFFLPVENYPNGIEQDEHDACSTHIAAYNLSGLLVGSLRLVKPFNGSLFPFEEHCTELFTDREYPRRDQCAEISRLVISKLYRRRTNDTVYGVSSQLVEECPDDRSINDRRKEKRDDSERRKLQPEILLGLLKHVYLHSKQLGISHWYMAVEKPLVRLLQRLLFFSLEPIGEQADYYGPVIPCILSVEYFEEALSNGDPVLFAWFQEASTQTLAIEIHPTSQSSRLIPYS